nr:ATP-binding protein [Azospirillum oleiclasticum]
MSGRQLLFLVAATLLPVVVFAALVTAQYSMQERHALESQLHQTALTAAAAVDRRMSQELAALSTLAAGEALDGGDYAGFHRQARRVLATVGAGWAALILSDADGALVDTQVPFGTPLPSIMDPATIRTVLDRRRPVVEAVLERGGVWPQPMIAIHVPVVRDGVARHALSALFPASVLRRTLGEHLAVPGGRISLYDRDGRIIARTLSAEAAAVGADDEAVGRRPTATVLGGLDGPSGAAFGAVSLEGVPVVMVHVPTPQAGWHLAAGVPAAMMGGLVRDSQMAAAAGGAAALLLALIVAVTQIRALKRRQDAERRLAVLDAKKDAERRLSDMVRNFPGVIYRRVRRPDGGGGFVYVSNTVNALFGVARATQPASDAVIADLMAAMPAETAARLEAAFAETALSLEPMQVEGEILDPAGRPRRFRTNATPWTAPDGSIIWDGVMLDITDLREAEIARQIGAERLAFALEFANAGIWDWEVPTDRLTWSDSLWRLLGHDGPQGEPTVAVLLAAIHPDDRAGFLAGVQSAIASAADYRAEYRVVLPDGAVRWIGAIARIILGPDGRPTRLTGLYLDITDRKRIEEELNDAKVEAERADLAKSKFLAAASHDLRQPVQSLMFFIHVLSERLADHPAASVVGTMQQALDALKSLLDGILDLSRLDAGVITPQVEPVRVGGLLNRIRAEYTPRFADKGLRLRVRHSDALVETDPALLGSILGNLVENALKYTESGGVLVAARRRGRWLRLEVWDTGIGIAPGHLTDIFNEFVQLANPERDRSQGLGLGLAIVKRLARLLQHPMTVRSIPGRGSVFAVTVPLHAEPEAFTADDAPKAAGGDGDARLVVVVDDDATVRVGLAAMLESWGYEVVAEAEGEAAVAALARIGRRPGVVLADYRLGEGGTGVDAIDAVRRSCGWSVPAILLTGDTAATSGLHADRAGFTIIHKPVTPVELRRIMDAIAPPSGDAAADG